MNIQKKVKLVTIGARIPPVIRDRVRVLASESGVKESEVYRQIITDFFYNDSQQKVVDLTTESNRK